MVNCFLTVPDIEVFPHFYKTYVKTSMLPVPIYLPVGREEMRDKLCFKTILNS